MQVPKGGLWMRSSELAEAGSLHGWRTSSALLQLANCSARAPFAHLQGSYSTNTRKTTWLQQKKWQKKMGNAQNRWPKFLTMPILHPWDSEEWYPSISIDWQVLVCGTERRNHRTKMTFNRVSFDLQAPVTHLLVWAEVLSVSQMQSGHFAPCCSTWNPRGNPSHPRTEAGTSPVGRKEEMLTLTPSLGHAKRSSWVAQFWAVLSFGQLSV